MIFSFLPVSFGGWFRFFCLPLGGGPGRGSSVAGDYLKPAAISIASVRLRVWRVLAAVGSGLLGDDLSSEMNFLVLLENYSTLGLRRGTPG